VNEERPAKSTHGHHESVLRGHQRRMAEDSAAYLLPRLEPGLSVLDIGCGPGTITPDLAALVAPGAVLAVDQIRRCPERGPRPRTVGWRSRTVRSSAGHGLGAAKALFGQVSRTVLAFSFFASTLFIDG